MLAGTLLTTLILCVAAEPLSPAPPPARDIRAVKAEIVPRPADAAINVHGASFGLLADRVARVHGLQLALVFSQTDEELRGAQVALGVNFVDGTFTGAQLALAANFATSARGLQSALLFNVADRLRGVQLAPGNYAEDAAGVQVGIVNKGIRIDGVRIAAANRADEMRGLQIGLANGTGSIRGVQLALLNVTNEASGVQIGLVNITRRTEGLQIGAVNISQQDDGESLGLLNLVKGGVHELALYATDTMLSNLELKLGGRHLYTALLAAYHPGQDLPAGTPRLARDTRRVGFGIGVGWRHGLRIGRLEALEIELNGVGLYAHLDDNWRDAPVLWSLRAGVVVRLFPAVGVLAGLAANAAVATGGQDADVGLGVADVVVRSGADTIRLYPGLFVGLQL